MGSKRKRSVTLEHETEMKRKRQIPEIVTAFAAFEEQFIVERLHVVFEVNFVERTPQLLVRVHLERVQVHAQRARKYHRILRYDRESLSQVVQTNRLDINVVDDYLTIIRLEYSKQSQ